MLSLHKSNLDEWTAGLYHVSDPVQWVWCLTIIPVLYQGEADPRYWVWCPTIIPVLDHRSQLKEKEPASEVDEFKAEPELWGERAHTKHAHRTGIASPALLLLPLGAKGSLRGMVREITKRMHYGYYRKVLGDTEENGKCAAYVPNFSKFYIKITLF